MDFREMMGESEESKDEAQGEQNQLGSFLEAHQKRLKEFELIHSNALDITKKNWEAVRLNQPVYYQDAIRVAKEMIQFLSNKTNGTSFFKKCSEPYYILNVVNVAWFSILLGKELQFPGDKLLDLTIAALLHDIGMALIPPEILTKKEKLAYDEFQQIKNHPENAKKILSSMKEISETVLDGVVEEHERENGTGYPEGKQGNQIHEFAKIIGLSDVFEAMTHHREYREMVSPNKAILEIIAEKGKLFHDKYIKSFLNTFTFYPIGTFVHLNTNEIGEVIDINRKYPTRPIIKLLIDKTGHLFSKPQIMVLYKKNLIYVKETLTERDVERYLEDLK